MVVCRHRIKHVYKKKEKLMENKTHKTSPMDENTAKRQGALFATDKTNHPKWSDYGGSCEIGGVGYWISGWLKRPKNGGAQYISLTFSAKDIAKPQDVKPDTVTRVNPSQLNIKLNVKQEVMPNNTQDKNSDEWMDYYERQITTAPF
jgi:hypothetical protein